MARHVPNGRKLGRWWHGLRHRAPGRRGVIASEHAHGRTFWDCTSPASGERIGQIEVMGRNRVTQAVERARHAQRAWCELPIKERAQRVLGFCDVLIENAEELVDLLVLETSKPRL